jgi:hypothetical protein
MKVENNARTFNTYAGMGSESNIPIRLEIAARVVQGFLANTSVSISEYAWERQCQAIARDCLVLADALIEAHNETCETS